MTTDHRPSSRHRSIAPRRRASVAPTTAPLALAPAIRTLAPSPTLAINEAIAARRAAGHSIVHLGFGEASLPLHPILRDALAEAASATGYAPVLGIPVLRDAIAGYLGRERGLALSADEIAVGPGSKPLLYALLLVLEGDVLIPAPSWVSYAPQARLAGRRVIPVATDPADWHRLTPRALAAADARARHAGADPRILIVNTPSNPTGGMFAQEDVEALAEWARSARVTVLSDEIYAELAHGWRQHVSPARFYPEGTIVTGGLSKAYAAGGWRLGYAALPAGAEGRTLRSALRALASEIWSAASAPIQEAAVAAYAPNAELAAHVRRSARLYAHATGRLHAALLGLGVVCPRPAGGFYLYPDFAAWRGALARRGVSTSAELARLLLDEHDVATLPGVAFGDAPDGLRLRLATSLLFAGEGDGTAAGLDAHLWSLIERADALLAEHPDEGEPLPLPMLDRAIERLAAFIATPDAPDQP